MNPQPPPTPTWTADVALSPRLAARLIERQFPALAPAQIEVLGEGWDNLALRVNREWVFRFPRRAIAAGLLEIEARFLPRLAPRLPVAIPCPQWRGQPDAELGYPYPFAGYRWLSGQTACRFDLTHAMRARVAEPLAVLLKALHTTPIDDAESAAAPGDTIRRADLAYRAPKLAQRLRSLNAPGLDVNWAAAANWVDAMAAAPLWSGAPRWVHGDLYARHLLLGEQGQLCGVIDWGDLHRGDPALDLSIAWSWLPRSAHSAFRAAYGTIDPNTWNRARLRALNYGEILLDYGSAVGDAEIRRVGEWALVNAAPSSSDLDGA